MCSRPCAAVTNRAMVRSVASARRGYGPSPERTRIADDFVHARAGKMSALLLDIEPGDEVIIPSFTFVRTANAFALREARCSSMSARTR